MEGTLWSGNLFSFTSPIDTIMDRDEYTIEEVGSVFEFPVQEVLPCADVLSRCPQLLAEDELLQEIKSNNMRLIDK